MKKPLVAALLLGAFTVFSARAECAKTTPQLLVEKLGKPDRVTKTENDEPRPPIPSVILEYSRAKVRIAMVAPDINKPPPYPYYCLLGAVDMNTNKAMDLTEATKRIKAAR